MSSSSNVPVFEPERCKATTREQWDTASQAWHDWGPTLQHWLGPATEQMLDMAGVKPGSATDGRRALKDVPRAPGVTGRSGATPSRIWLAVLWCRQQAWH